MTRHDKVVGYDDQEQRVSTESLMCRMRVKFRFAFFLTEIATYRPLLFGLLFKYLPRKKKKVVEVRASERWEFLFSSLFVFSCSHLLRRVFLFYFPFMNHTNIVISISIFRIKVVATLNCTNWVLAYTWRAFWSRIYICTCVCVCVVYCVFVCLCSVARAKSASEQVM